MTLPRYKTVLGHNLPEVMEEVNLAADQGYAYLDMHFFNSKYHILMEFEGEDKELEDLAKKEKAARQKAEKEAAKKKAEEEKAAAAQAEAKEKQPAIRTDTMQGTQKTKVT